MDISSWHKQKDHMLLFAKLIPETQTYTESSAYVEMLEGDSKVCVHGKINQMQQMLIPFIPTTAMKLHASKPRQKQPVRDRSQKCVPL